MHFTVGCNWEPELIDGLDFPEVTSLFGGLPDTLISGGRYSGLINPPELSDIKEYIQKVHIRGLEFDYNINSICMANMEFSQEGYQAIVDYLASVADLGVNSLTVSIPSLLAIVKKHFPHLKTKISTFQKIDSVAMAQHFEDLGADAIMLSEHINRDFELLRAIRAAVHCKLVVIANVGCIYGCPNMHSHANSIAHSGSKDQSNHGLGVESYQINCALHRLTNPMEFIRARWIRPEDLHYYEELGINMIKIIDRHSSTAALLERTAAYHRRSYHGNLVNFLGQMLNVKTSQKMNLDYIFQNIRDSQTPKLMSLLRAMEIAMSDLVDIDNQKFPGNFLEGFTQQNCRYRSCDKCNYCRDIAAQTVRIASEDKRRRIIAKLTNIKQGIIDGSLLF